MSLTNAVPRLRRWSVLLAAAALVVSACGGSGKDETTSSATTTTTSGSHVAITGVPGVTDSEIRFAAFGTDSNNPLGTCVFKCYLDGVNAYFAYRNSEGGIYGRKLVVSKTVDDELTKDQQSALQIVSANDTFAAFSATLLPSGWVEMVKAGIPLYVLNIHPEAAQPTIFGNVGVLCISCTSRTTAYVAELVHAKKVGVLGYGVSPNSRLAAQAMKASIEKYSADIGGATVAYFNDDLVFGLPNGIAPEVTAMKRAGVDFVTTALDLNGMKTLVGEAQRQGMGDVPMLHPNSYDQDFIKANAPLVEGDYVGITFRPFEAQAAGSAMGLYKTWMAKTGGTVHEHSVDGWINASAAYEALKAAGPNFDRAKVIAALDKVKGFTAGGLVPPIDYGRQHVAPTEDDPATHGPTSDCTALLKVHNGDFQVVGGAATPWVCWPGKTRAWSTPKPTNFK